VGLESTLPIGILKSRSALPMAIAVFRPTSSNWRSSLLLSGFAACLSGTSRGELAWRISRTYPPFCKALMSASPCKSCASTVPANHIIAAANDHNVSVRIARV
jgi:hypothetical protein